MSIQITSLVYKLDLGTVVRKALMLLLADKASDDGKGIFASKQTMADELCCSKRTVQNVIGDFLSEGLLLADGNHQVRNGHTVNYSLNLGSLESLPRVKRWAGYRGSSRAGEADSPVKRVPSTGAQDSPKPTENLPSSGAKAPSHKGRKAFPTPPGVSNEQWAAFCQQRSKPLNDRAYSLICDKLFHLAAQGHEPGHMIDLAIERGWETVFAPFTSKDTRHAGPSSNLGKTSAAIVAFGQRDDDRAM